MVKSYREILIRAKAIRFANWMAFFMPKKEAEEPPLPEIDLQRQQEGTMKGATAKNLEPKDLASYYPFRVGWKLGNVAEMSKVIPADFADFVIYTSALEHTHPNDGARSLEECYKVMKPGAKMFLSCPNTPGNGYETQYRAHVYEWGYDELKAKLAEIGFGIVQEVGLVTSVREMDSFYANQPPALRDFYNRMKAYVPAAFLTAFMAIPFPREAKELLFIVQKPKGERIDA